MIIRLVAIQLLFAADLVLVNQPQNQTGDAALWSTIIIAVVGLLTLVIQTYGQIQMAKIKDRQDTQAEVVRKVGDQVTDQSAQLTEVHTTVNSGRDKMLEELRVLTTEVATLKGANTERQKGEAQTLNQAIGAAAEKVRADAAPRPPTSPLGATDAKPMHVEVVNPEPVEVDVVKKEESK